MTTEGNEQEQDSPIINQLRKELREAKKEAKSAYQQARRDIEFENAYESFGLPESVRGLVENEIGDKEVSRENMQEAVASLGLDGLGQAVNDATTESEEGGEGEGYTFEPEPTQPSVADNLAEVSDLGNQVAQASKGQAGDNLTDRINSAETPEELAEIMAEAGR